MMIEPTQADIGRRVRYHTHARTGLATLAWFDDTSCWLLQDNDPEPKPRKWMRCLLTWVRS